jgi:hypothetical protein
MVTNTPLEQFENYVDVRGTWKQNEQTGLIDVQGDVRIKWGISHEGETLIAFPFGDVTGDFDCHSRLLTSLVNAPKRVGGLFACGYQPIKSLAHAPEHVGGDYWMTHMHVENLKGLASHIGGKIYLEWAPMLHLLRTLVAQGGVQLENPTPFSTWADTDKTRKVSAILNTYKGSGKAGAIQAAGELIRVGLRENARW